jgi:hypothetical protein
MFRAKSALFGICLLLGCSGGATADGSPVTCRVGEAGGSAALHGRHACNATYGLCSDGQTYSVKCPGGPAPCTCQLNGIEGKHFVDTGGACGGSSPKALAAIDEGCGWNLFPPTP